jgi:PAS domain S-box-containing protein
MSSNDVLVERELRAARERESDYRTRLARHRALSLRLRAHAALLRDALRDSLDGWNMMSRLLADVARLSSQALDIPRTSIWLFDEKREHLVCRFQLPAGSATEGMVLPVATCAGYVRALTTTDMGAVAVDDAWSDARTAELRDYLRTYNVGALLDIPILGPGQVHGVVCHEHEGGPRHWQEEEIDFATDVGAMVALVLEAERRISAEHIARGSEARYQNLVESLPVTVYSFQAHTGQLEYLSPRIQELGGLAAERYLVAGGIDNWLQAIEPEDREPVRRRLSGHISEGFERELIYRIRLPDGTRRWVRDTCGIVRDITGTPIAVQGTLADITALKEAELERAELDRRYRRLLENADLLAVILSASGHVEMVNDCFVRLTGFTREEAMGADGFTLILPEREREEVRARYLAAIRNGDIVPRFETGLRTRAGSLRRILWTNTLIRSSAGTVVGSASLGLDITERVEAEALQLQQQKVESLGRLAATVAHDFNNLLTVIAASTDSLGKPSNEFEAGAIADIEAAVRQATGLTRSLLAYARRETIAPTLLSVDETVTSSMPFLRQIVGSDLELSVALDTASERVVMDATQLRQVVLNLVGNAVDATRGYGHHVRVSTGLVVMEADQARNRGLFSEGTFLVLCVSDDGRGMSRELQERAFDPFFTTKSSGEGTGLGLAMCTSIVRRAGGFISIESVPGRGATLRVHLPLARSRGDTASSPPPAMSSDLEKTPVPAVEPPRILVVESDESTRYFVTRVLSSEGIEVVDATDLKGARAALAGSSVDLLLTARALPDGDGEGLAREARELHRARHVVLVAAEPGGDHAPDLTKELADSGIDAVLAKPLRVENLLDTVLGLLHDGHLRSV